MMIFTITEDIAHGIVTVHGIVGIVSTDLIHGITLTLGMAVGTMVSITVGTMAGIEAAGIMAGATTGTTVLVAAMVTITTVLQVGVVAITTIQ